MFGSFAPVAFKLKPLHSSRHDWHFQFVLSVPVKWWYKVCRVDVWGSLLQLNFNLHALWLAEKNTNLKQKICIQCWNRFDFYFLEVVCNCKPKNIECTLCGSCVAFESASCSDVPVDFALCVLTLHVRGSAEIFVGWFCRTMKTTAELLQSGFISLFFLTVPRANK